MYYAKLINFILSKYHTDIVNINWIVNIFHYQSIYNTQLLCVFYIIRMFFYNYFDFILNDIHIGYKLLVIKCKIFIVIIMHYL